MSKTIVLSLPGKMRSKLSLFVFGALVAVSVFGLAHATHASVTPTLNLTSMGDGDTVQLNVTGDPEESVVLYYTKSSVGSTFTVLGNTDANGNYVTTVSSASYGIVTATPVHVTVNGLNGLSSATEYWPTVTGTGTTTNQISLSQSGLVMTVGQTNSIVATNNTSSSLYVATNSSPSIANINVSGTTITISALGIGTTTATICAVGQTYTCPSLSVTVQNSGAGQLAFSQSTVSLVAGQLVTDTVSGGNGSYIISSNSNPSLIFANVNGQAISLSAGSTSSGTGAITVCSSDLSACGVINVTAGVSGSTTVSFSLTNPLVTAGSVSTVTIYGGTTGVYYVSSNSSPSVVQPNISGSTLSLTGLNSGTSSINICSSNGSCAVLQVSVTGSATGGIVTLSQTNVTLPPSGAIAVAISGGTAPYYLPVTSGSGIYQASLSGNTVTITAENPGSSTVSVCSSTGSCTSLYLTVTGTGTTSTSGPYLSQSNLSLSIGQSSTVTISGAGGYYIPSNTNPNVASVAISGSEITVSPITYGSTSLSVCQTGGQCVPLYVSIGTGTITSTTGTGAFLSFSQTNPTLSIGSAASISVSGGDGAYTLAFNSNPAAVSAISSGNVLTLTGEENGVSVIVVCAGADSCGAISVAVGTATAATSTTTMTTLPAGCTSTIGFSGVTGQSCNYGGTPIYPTTPVAPVTPVVATPAPVYTAPAYTFTLFLDQGSSGNEVTQLQIKLTALGYYSGPENGNFGPLTKAAVERFQSAKGIAAVGYVGPSTRLALNNS